MAIKALGDFLVSEGILSQDQLQLALDEQKKNGKKLGQVIIDLGYISDEALAQLMAMHNDMKYIDLSTDEPEPEAMKLLSRDIVRKYQCLPFAKRDNRLILIIADPLEANIVNLTDHIRHGLGLRAEYAMSTPAMIQNALEKFLGMSGPLRAVNASSEMAQQQTEEKEPEGSDMSFQDAMQEIQSTDDILSNLEVVDEKTDDEEASEGSADDAPVIKLVNTLIHNAIAMKASDIHIEPYEKAVSVRYRVDGQLQEMKPLPTVLKRAVASRIKILARMDIVERRKPQDGKLRIQFGKKKIDLRVSTLPIVFGEKIVMRILDSSVTKFDLSSLGFEPDDQVKFEKAIRSPYGMVLVTGPTGSGKTRTLYTALNTINSRNRNITTAEDPVEFQIKGINQVNIDEDVGLTYPAVLRALLRQDPNIILVGEIRDIETGSIAIKAAMTGHLVLSTLHTNDAPSTVTRLVDMGIDNIQVGTSVVCVVAQRLMRILCDSCKEETVPDPEKLATAGIDPAELAGVTLYQPKGCPSCENKGYAGRRAIYEVMVMAEPIRKAIFTRQDVGIVRDRAIESGMRTLRGSAMLKLKRGESSLDEVMRVTMAE